MGKSEKDSEIDALDSTQGMSRKVAKDIVDNTNKDSLQDVCLTIRLFSVLFFGREKQTHRKKQLPICMHAHIYM